MKKWLIDLALLAMLVSAPTSMAGAIYKWTDANGRVQLGDQPPDPATAQRIAVHTNIYKGGAGNRQEHSSGAAGPKVVIYTSKQCGYCARAKAWFDSKGIPYTEYDVENSRKGRRDYKKLGGRAVPIILVGEQRLNGFSEARLAVALSKAGYTL